MIEIKGTSVRVVERDGEPWFVAKDVAELLGYGTPRDAIRRYCKGRVTLTLPSAGGEQDTQIIPERDVYRMVMRSPLPAAESFEDWVVGTVLPSIRKHGGYIAGQENTTDPAVIMANAVLVAHRVIAEQAVIASPKLPANGGVTGCV